MALSETHLGELTMQHAPPPPSQQSDSTASLVRLQLWLITTCMLGTRDMVSGHKDEHSLISPLQQLSLEPNFASDSHDLVISCLRPGAHGLPQPHTPGSGGVCGGGMCCGAWRLRLPTVSRSGRGATLQVSASPCDDTAGQRQLLPGRPATGRAAGTT